jgi:hypothetical protein
MQKRTSVMSFLTIAPWAMAALRRFSLVAVLIFAGGLVLGACGPAMIRPKVSKEDLVKLRTAGDERSLEAGREVLAKLVDRTKIEYDRTPPVGGRNRR